MTNQPSEQLAVVRMATGHYGLVDTDLSSDTYGMYASIHDTEVGATRELEMKQLTERYKQAKKLYTQLAEDGSTYAASQQLHVVDTLFIKLQELEMLDMNPDNDFNIHA